MVNFLSRFKYFFICVIIIFVSACAEYYVIGNTECNYIDIVRSCTFVEKVENWYLGILFLWVLVSIPLALLTRIFVFVLNKVGVVSEKYEIGKLFSIILTVMLLIACLYLLVMTYKGMQEGKTKYAEQQKIIVAQQEEKLSEQKANDDSIINATHGLKNMNIVVTGVGGPFSTTDNNYVAKVGLVVTGIQHKTLCEGVFLDYGDGTPLYIEETMRIYFKDGYAKKGPCQLEDSHDYKKKGTYTIKRLKFLEEGKNVLLDSLVVYIN